MLRRPHALALLLALPASAQAEIPDRAPPHRYEIRARLDPEEHVVHGSERIRWRNTGEKPVDELYFHLYLNAFAHERTVFMRESGGQLRGAPFRGRGGIEILALQLEDGTDLLGRARTDLVEDDATQMRVELPEAVPPEGELRLRCRFRAELPPLFARTGWVRDFHLVAQWFPKLARLESDGTWATFPYHGVGEFYADFADYDLTVSTPPEFLVAASGRQVKDHTADGRRVRRFVARWVHDAVFVAWPHFREHRERVDGVDVRFVHPPGYGPALERHVAVTRRGLARFGRLYGSYPYDALTVVVPPRGAEGGAGMEYPTLFVTWGPWFVVPGVRTGLQDEVTAHELAHQWFQGMIATDEVRWPLLDEGLANWATWDLLGALHGRDRSAVGSPWPPVDGFELLRQLAFRGGATPPPAEPAHAFSPFAYARAIYGRVPVVLETVARSFGRRRFLRALGTYARRHRFAHPRPPHLYAAFDEVYGAGFSDRVLRPAFERGAHAGVRIARVKSRPLERGVRTEVRARRHGHVPVPTPVQLLGTRQPPGLLADGERSVTLVHRGPEPVAGAVDPPGHVLLDPSELDDARRPPELAPRTRALGSRALLLLQTFLGWLGP
ncbi:MAG: M1 family metallopeptidase [Myxococcota bacterium]